MADFDDLLELAWGALDEMFRGNPNGYKELYSRREDITLGNPFGGFGRGWDGVVDQLERGASTFRDGAVTAIDIVEQAVEGDIAYTVVIERGRAKVAGSTEMSDIAVRVTCIYRREGDAWKLVHRHADPRVGRQRPESVLER